MLIIRLGTNLGSMSILPGTVSSIIPFVSQLLTQQYPWDALYSRLIFHSNGGLGLSLGCEFHKQCYLLKWQMMVLYIIAALSTTHGPTVEVYRCAVSKHTKKKVQCYTSWHPSVTLSTYSISLFFWHPHCLLFLELRTKHREEEGKRSYLWEGFLTSISLIMSSQVFSSMSFHLSQSFQKRKKKKKKGEGYKPL